MSITLSRYIKKEIQNNISDPTINSDWIENARISIKELDPVSGLLIVRTDTDPDENLSHIEFTEESVFGKEIAKIVSVIDSEFIQLESIKTSFDNISLEKGKNLQINLDFSMEDFESYFSQLFSTRFRVDPTFELWKYDYGFGSASNRLEFKTENPEIHPQLTERPLPMSYKYTVYEYDFPQTVERIMKKIQVQFVDPIQIKDNTVDVRPFTCVVCPEENSSFWVHIVIIASELEEKLPDHLVE